MNQDRKERAYAAMAVLGGQAFCDAAAECARVMTEIVMHPSTDAEARQQALQEYHAITRLNGYLAKWADDVKRDKDG